ncbi:DUF4228 domain-containing protein [Cephalotus follicularis]|uniref:DUF4228 domain-containing protein n=1 Tax=Cephalotus follicularis TaxID=3775 RepID=A0A1Q3BY55_CEPFO|nr:DUF4228 domain-containing protein [Cephalotus follicularis]
MGNCLCQHKDSSVHVVGHDLRDTCDKIMKNMINEEDLGDHKGSDHVTSSTTTTTTTTTKVTEVKIKITKKQLEELLSRVDMKQVSVEQVLAQLINVSDRCEIQQRCWRPALQSIPE